MKGDTPCVKIHFQVKSKEQKWGSVSQASSGNDLRSKWSISGMLRHLMVWGAKWNIPFKKETWLQKCSIVAPQFSKGGTYSLSHNGQKKSVFHGRKWEAGPEGLTHVQRGPEQFTELYVGRIRDTSLHHWLTPYKCFSWRIHAHPAARTIEGLWIMQNQLTAFMKPLVSTEEPEEMNHSLWEMTANKTSQAKSD